MKPKTQQDATRRNKHTQEAYYGGSIKPNAQPPSEAYNPRPQTLTCTLATPNLKTRNPQPATRNPKPDGGQVVDVACGAEHSLCMSKEGKVFAWGRGAGGQLGQGDDIQDKTLPAQVTTPYMSCLYV